MNLKQATSDNSRVTARIPGAVRKTLLQGAALSGATLNQFLIQASLKEAEAIIERETIVKLGKRDTSAFFAALDNPPAPSSRLQRAVADYKKAAISAKD